ncbi:hypothetical protein [Aquimarina aggregata]|uniref:hypothetical protein n=1 Tax=Aquimarina aggregata TaxID=1642818 RepID=UPI00249201ED|nr:hypothetical protein [Aquimarina aggregata]
MILKKELEAIDKAATKMLTAFEVFSLKEGLDLELKKECINLMRNEVSRRKLKIILFYYTKPVVDKINNFLKGE